MAVGGIAKVDLNQPTCQDSAQPAAGLRSTVIIELHRRMMQDMRNYSATRTNVRGVVDIYTHSHHKAHKHNT